MSSSASNPDKGDDLARTEAGLTSALRSVKDLVSIVMGLALTHTILTLLTPGPGDGRNSNATGGEIVSLSHVSLQAVLCALAVITAIIRFYHGNNQLLDLLYGEASRKPEGSSNSGGIGGNFIVIMVQSVFFALMSFYINGSRELTMLFGLLLVLDIFWYIANLTTTDTDPRALRTQRNWMINNFGFLLILIVLYVSTKDAWGVTAAAGAILLNTVIDFVISWRTYFPRLRNLDAPVSAEG